MKHQFWQERRNRIRTGLGQWLGGHDVIVRGRSLLGELIYELSAVQMLVFNVTGRLISANLATWIEKTQFFTAYPDARIWCNQIGALAGQGGTSPVAAAVAGSLAADSKAYGSKVQYLTVTQLARLYRERQAGATWADLVSGVPQRGGVPVVVGFARPVAVADERLEPARQLTERLGFTPGVYLQFAEQLADYLHEFHGLQMNAAGYTCAFMMDQGFSAQELYRIRTCDVSSGVLACYTDYYSQPDQAFLPQYCTDTVYVGPAPRELL